MVFSKLPLFLLYLLLKHADIYNINPFTTNLIGPTCPDNWIVNCFLFLKESDFCEFGFTCFSIQECSVLYIWGANVFPVLSGIVLVICHRITSSILGTLLKSQKLPFQIAEGRNSWLFGKSQKYDMIYNSKPKNPELRKILHWRLACTVWWRVVVTCKWCGDEDDFRKLMKTIC